MTLKERITEDMKTAMRSGEKDRLAVIRLLQAAIKQREVDERITLDDAQVTSVLEKMIKQRKESVVAFEKGARADLVAKETAEIAVLQALSARAALRSRTRRPDRRSHFFDRRRVHQGHGQGDGRGEIEGGRQSRHGRGRRPHQSQARRLTRVLAGRGIATAGALILIALVCISISRKIEAERRELGHFPRHRLPLVIGGSLAALASLHHRRAGNIAVNGVIPIFRLENRNVPIDSSMAGRIPQSFIDELTARADIVELIGSRVELKKAGREYRACCPFHNEKTPSFWVSPQKQFYHCFGCGAHGTALGFLMEYDKLSFPKPSRNSPGGWASTCRAKRRVSRTIPAARSRSTI